MLGYVLSGYIIEQTQVRVMIYCILCIMFSKKLWVKSYEPSHMCQLQHVVSPKVVVGVVNGQVWDKDTTQL